MADTQPGVSSHKSQKQQGVTLAQYVHRRNGVPLGASGSLQNMLYRSFGAGSFAGFWQYWNPFWGYALGRYVYAPLRRLLPAALALLLTFVISGGIHDAATMLIRRSAAFFFTPWFFLMGLGVVIGQALRFDYAHRSWAGRVTINLAYLLGCLGLTLLVF